MIKYTKELIESVINECLCYSDVARKLGKRPDGGTVAHIGNRIRHFNIDISHFKRVTKPSRPHRNNSEILTNNPKRINREYCETLRNAMLSSNIEYKCKECSINEWQNKKITLHIDHINGNPLDNNLENLRFLCPNCHSQTSTYGSKRLKKNQKVVKEKIKRKRKTKIEWPSNEELSKLVWEKPSIILSKELGVSDKAIGMRCIRNNIEKPPRGYWAKKAAGNI